MRTSVKSNLLDPMKTLAIQYIESTSCYVENYIQSKSNNSKLLFSLCRVQRTLYTLYPLSNATSFIVMFNYVVMIHFIQVFFPLKYSAYCPSKYLLSWNDWMNNISFIISRLLCELDTHNQDVLCEWITEV